MNDVVRFIEQSLREAFSPTHLQISDDSQQHAGHAGAAQHGGGHFSVYIVSELFVDQTPIQRHRMVYDALRELMHVQVHALSIRAQTPDEFSSIQS